MLVFKPNLAQRCALYPFLYVLGYQVIVCILFLWQFLQMCEKMKITLETQTSFYKLISQEWLGQFPLDLVCNLGQHLHRQFGLVQTKDRKATNRLKFVHC